MMTWSPWRSTTTHGSLWKGLSIFDVCVTEPDLLVGWSGPLLVYGDRLCPSFSVCIQHRGCGRLDQSCLQKDLAVSFQSLDDRGGCSESFR